MYIRRVPQTYTRVETSRQERLAYLSQEAGELVQILGKIFMHGMESSSPFTGDKNSDLLHEEVGDVLLAIILMVENGDLNAHKLMKRIDFKVHMVQQIMHHKHKYPKIEV